MNSSAPAVVSHSQPMVMLTENTALTSATFVTATKVVITMNDEQFNRELRYQASMNFFTAMLEKGLISREQYDVIDTKMLEKYQPLLGTLFAHDHLQ